MPYSWECQHFVYICPHALIKSLAHMFYASPRFSHQYNGIYKVIVSEGEARFTSPDVFCFAELQTT